MVKIKKKVERYIAKVWKAFNKMEMRVIPGNVAFFFVLALIPIIMIILFLTSCFSLSVDSVIDLIYDVFPKEASNIIVSVISGKGFDTGVGAFNVAIFMIASNGTYAVINGANTLYGIKDSDALRDRVKSLFLLVILVFLILFLIFVPVLGGKILGLFKEGIIVWELLVVYKFLKWPFSFLLVYVTVKLIYTMAPSKVISSKSTTYGALFTTFGWVIATIIFSCYLEYFANYNVIYGNLSSIIILMMWIYIISYLFVLGIAINSVHMADKK